MSIATAALGAAFVKPIFILANSVLFIVATPIVAVGLALEGKLSPKITYLDLFRICLNLPLGSYFIQGAIFLTAIYTSTIGPEIVSLESTQEGEVRCTARMQVRPWHKNPFGSCHLAALCNFGEFPGGVAMMAKFQVSKPRVRGIPTQLKTKFFAKARGTLTGESTTAKFPDNVEELPADVICTTRIYDEKRVLVAETEVTWTVSAAGKRKVAKTE